jgi:hypothetical protein
MTYQEIFKYKTLFRDYYKWLKEVDNKTQHQVDAHRKILQGKEEIMSDTVAKYIAQSFTRFFKDNR